MAQKENPIDRLAMDIILQTVLDATEQSAMSSDIDCRWMQDALRELNQPDSFVYELAQLLGFYSFKKRMEEAIKHPKKLNALAKELVSFRKTSFGNKLRDEKCLI